MSRNLTDEEQAHAREALNFLRVRCGGWMPLTKALRFSRTTLTDVSSGRGIVTPTMALQLARFAEVPVDAVLSGTFPPVGACPHCWQTR
jgi:hypothetical protein